MIQLYVPYPVSLSANYTNACISGSVSNTYLSPRGNEMIPHDTNYMRHISKLHNRMFK